LHIAGGGRSVGDGIGDGVQAVEDGVGGSCTQDGEVVLVAEVNCVRNAESFGLGVDDPVAVIVFEGDAYVETV
jgi:hypothetical protein